MNSVKRINGVMVIAKTVAVSACVRRNQRDRGAGKGHAPISKMRSVSVTSKVLAVALWLFCASASAYRMEPSDSVAVGTSWASAVAVGDVTGDGRSDVILGTTFYFDPENDYTIFIFPQRSDGRLGAPIKHRYVADYTNVLGITLGDVNKYAVSDIVVSHDHGLTVLVANGSGDFSSSRIAMQNPIRNVAVTDLNDDGYGDYLAQESGPTIHAVIGDGNGKARSTSVAAFDVNGLSVFKLNDVTSDGLNDIVASQGSSLLIYRRRSDGSFAAKTQYVNPAAGPWGYEAIEVGDFNSDGRNDVIAGTPANNPDARVWLHLQLQDGTLDEAVSLATYDIPSALVASDLDHNGKEDFLVAHSGWAAVGHYLQFANGMAPEVLAATIYNERDQALAAGDFNGDGCIDAAIADHNVGLGLLHGRDCYEPLSISSRHDGDFDGDGVADILWHNSATGASTIWKSANSATQIRMTPVTDTRWIIAGIGDFNGDGRSDVLGHHTVSGANVLWFSADSRTSLSLQRVSDLNWQIVGIGDFDGNTKADILWRHKFTGANAIWKEALYAQAQHLTTITDKEWTVVGVGDFDGNGKADILWRHRGDGRNTIWRDANAQTLQRVSPVSDLGWQVAGLGDFDHDGRADILWRHSFDGRTAIWHDATATRSRNLTQITDLSWKIAGVGDYDDDGHSDILWRQNRTGANVVWRNADYTNPMPVTGVTNMQWGAER